MEEDQPMSNANAEGAAQSPEENGGRGRAGPGEHWNLQGNHHRKSVKTLRELKQWKQEHVQIPEQMRKQRQIA